MLEVFEILKAVLDFWPRYKKIKLSRIVLELERSKVSYYFLLSVNTVYICTQLKIFANFYTGFLSPRTPTMMMSSTTAGKQLQKANIHLGNVSTKRKSPILKKKVLGNEEQERYQ